MGFREQDRIRDLERQVSRLQDDTARLPITWPTSTPGTETRILLARVDETGGIDDGDSTFQVDNIDMVSGADPRSDTGSATEELTVSNSFGLTLAENDLVIVFYDVDSDTWIALAPGSGSSGSSTDELQPDIIVRLTEDADASTTSVLLGAYETSNAALLPVSIGAAISIGDALGFGALGLSGQKWVAKWSQAAGSYQLAFELIALNILRVSINQSTVAFDDATFAVDGLTLGNGRIPVDSSGDPLTALTVSNTGKIVGVNNDVITIYHNRDAGTDESDMWSSMPEGEEPQTAVAILTGTVTAAVVTTTDVTYGTGSATLKGDAGSVTVKNLSETSIVGSSPTPVALALIMHEGDWIITNVMDFRGGPGFTSGAAQYWIHQESSEDFELVTICDEDVVTEVLIESDKLRYKKHAWDSCTITTEDVADIGECDA